MFVKLQTDFKISAESNAARPVLLNTLLKRMLQNVAGMQRSQTCMFDNEGGEFLNCYQSIGFLCQQSCECIMKRNLHST